VNPDPAEAYTYPEPVAPGLKKRYWLHAALLLIALATTSFAGAAFAWAFSQNRPPLAEDFIPGLVLPFSLLQGLPYSITLLTILLAHELGHFLTCRYYGIDASLPYFIGVPTIIGTFGAFIRIRSAIPSRRQLFDVAVAGPLAGFAFIVPALGIGLAYSKIIPGVVNTGDVVFGTPLLIRALESLIFPGVPWTDICLHPVARAAWVGVLATALNLMPVGQLDGGHIVYALAARWHRPLTLSFIALLVPCGLLFSYTWLFWAVVLFLVARRHPMIYDNTPVGSGRTRLALLSLAIFVLSFSLTPIRI